MSLGRLNRGGLTSQKASLWEEYRGIQSGKGGVWKGDR